MHTPLDFERQTRLQAAMQQDELAAVLAWRAEEVVLTIGACPYLGMTLCLYPRTGEPIVYRFAYEPPDVVPPYLAQRIYTSWDDLQQLLAADLNRLALGHAPIGFARDSGRQVLPSLAAELPALTPAIIERLLAEVSTSDASAFFAAQSQHKTSREVVAIRRSNAVAASGLRVFFDALTPGLAEAEVAGRVEAAIHAQTGRDSIRAARGWAYVQSGPNTLDAGTYSRSSGRALAAGDLVVIELATCVDGYWSDLTRTGVVGQPTDQQIALLNVVREAQAAALEMVRVGVTHAGVDQAARDYLAARGYGSGFTHATGHHVGFRYHDHGPLLQPDSAAPLEEGMIITVEPGVYGVAFGGGARFEDNVLVTADGARCLSPRELIG